MEGIDEMTPEGVYKYLGLQQNLKIDHSQLKIKFHDEYRKRVTKIVNTKLSGKNLITAINTWAIPSLTYSFGVVKWSNT